MKTNQSSIQEAALFFTLCAFIALAACSKPSSKDAGHDSDAPLQGTLLLTGSSTMAPLISDIAKRFELAHPNVQITVKTGGSMRGAQDAREGVADIGMASRALTAAESDLSGMPMARDGICLLVNKDNPVQSLTDAQVAAIYIGSVTNWKNVGGLDESITVITRAEGRSELELFLAYFKIKTTSVSVSSALISELVKESNVVDLSKVVSLMNEHANDPGAFLTNDPKGKQVPDYLCQLAEHMVNEQTTLIGELALLRQNIEHIKEIIVMQQSYAKISGFVETVKISDLVEDALSMNVGSLQRHEVEVLREFDDVPPINTEKHKVLQILVNLVRNAKHACDESGCEEKLITLRIARCDDQVRISVVDSGIGIPPENLTRIFNHGFTTRKDGHGFGLHSAVLAAVELGGSLSAHSDGLGHGAIFTLELPLNARREMAC